MCLTRAMQRKHEAFTFRTDLVPNIDTSQHPLPLKCYLPVRAFCIHSVQFSSILIFYCIYCFTTNTRLTIDLRINSLSFFHSTFCSSVKTQKCLQQQLQVLPLKFLQEEEPSLILIPRYCCYHIIMYELILCINN